MKKYLKITLISTGLLAAYPLATWLALNFYPDDPAAMVWTDREAFNRKFINSIDAGQVISQDLVQQKLGGPDITEAIQQDGVLFQLVYYRTKRDISDGITTKAECTPLLYRERRLIATGTEAEQQFRQLQEPARR